MKNVIYDIVGKRIKGVIAKEGPGPSHQLFLVFDDDTYLEFYAYSEIFSCGELSHGGADGVRQYMSTSHKIVNEHVLEG